MTPDFRDAVIARLRPWRVTNDRERVDDAGWPAPWVVVDFPPLLRESDRWEGSDNGRLVGSLQTACVGETTDQATRLGDRVADLLTGWSPVVPGWVLWPLRMDTSPRVLGWSTQIPDRRLVQVVTTWAWHAERTV